MKKIAFIHSNRSDWALIEPIVKKQGMFLYQQEIISPFELRFSNTIKKISRLMIYFDRVFELYNYDFVVIPGDRYEVFAAAVVAYHRNIPIIHLYGGETTQGSLDDGHRNMITSMATYHFTAHEQYTKRVAQIKKSKDNIWTVGCVTLDNMPSFAYTKGDIEKKLGFKFYPIGYGYGLVTYHPDTTKNKQQNLQELNELIKVIETASDFQWIICSCNSDRFGNMFNSIFKKLSIKHHDRVIFIDNHYRNIYLSLMQYADFVIGNSSSGIVEAPYYYVPSINIGDRQKGRIQADTVSDVPAKYKDIVQVLKKVLDVCPLNLIERAKNIGKHSQFYSEGATDKIIEVLNEL